MQAIDLRSARHVALKVYSMAGLDDLNYYQVYREVRLHSSLVHDSIIHLYAAFQVRNNSSLQDILCFLCYHCSGHARSENG